jgi:hypothetical protein
MTSPWFSEVMLRQRELELEQRARTAHRRYPRDPEVRLQADPVLLRLCTVGDEQRLDDLAALEGRPQPTGSWVVAEVDGLVVAALPLVSGPPLADPFRLTGHLLPLLELRRTQLNRAEPHRRSALRATLRGFRHPSLRSG